LSEVAAKAPQRVAQALAGALVEHVRPEPGGEGAAGVLLRCRYPQGEEVLCSAAIQHADGLVTREIRLQVWDG
jgi:hypothetical protein